jgi:LytS/YehU family sensor histidine kinase
MAAAGRCRAGHCALLLAHAARAATLPADTTARLAELQSRIRPHFLFNTLNTAITLVRLDPARAENVLEDLAELFRVALTDSGESVSWPKRVALAQALPRDRADALRQDRLQVSWELDDDAGAARVPPLLLQPLVENAVRHGVEPAADGGVIRMRTRVKRAHAVVSIVNTRAQAALAARQRHRAAQRARAPAADARRGRAVRNPVGARCVPCADRGAAVRSEHER